MRGVRATDEQRAGDARPRRTPATTAAATSDDRIRERSATQTRRWRCSVRKDAIAGSRIPMTMTSGSALPSVDHSPNGVRTRVAQRAADVLD